MERDTKIVFMDQVEIEQVSWLLYPFIPYGKITIIQGDPGEGKTSLILQVIARLSNGEQIYDGECSRTEDGVEVSRTPVNILYQTAEDGYGDTIKPRLMKAGADFSRIAFIDDSDETLTVMDDRLETAIRKLDAKVVVLDPIQGYLGSGIDMHRANEIRPLMAHLSQLAQKYKCAIILIGHMNKNDGGKASYRGLGSIDIVAAARSVLLVGRMKDERDVRVLAHVKSSLAPIGQSMTFCLGENGNFFWEGESDVTADQLLTGVSRGEKIRHAKLFLGELLREVPMKQSEVEALAKEEGIKERTLKKAKHEMNIKSEKIGTSWYWSLTT